eukprot:CAMPEP_0185845010 /NCGR_PEP_ID=MMETSP1354-20130828/1080_1 /TAXON_ID=708628 /ORGANISM="Erythrolobus madagascarensis, Strain CCMP3276" /LENGTH=227 /DNA_ID=CAMNT_0028544859 /DNA_START=97 /DNA_END=780 /DNA_ORIENTATION=-
MNRAVVGLVLVASAIGVVFGGVGDFEIAGGVNLLLGGSAIRTLVPCCDKLSVASFKASSKYVSPNEVIDFSFLIRSPCFEKWTIDFGDGASLEGTNTLGVAEHSFGADGTYTVTLSAENSRGRRVTKELTIVVGGTCSQDCDVLTIAAFSCQRYLYVGQKLVFSFVIKSPCFSKWSVDFGDGHVQEGTNTVGVIKYSWSNPGVYDVVMTAYDSRGNVVSKTRTLTVV